MASLTKYASTIARSRRPKWRDSNSGAVRVGASAADLDNGSSLESGLVGHWTLDGKDTQSTITDRSGQGNHGYFIGGATSSAKVIGKFGQALSFNGTSNRVDFGDIDDLDAATQASFCMWLKYTQSPVSSDGTLISKYSTGNVAFLFWVDDVSGVSVNTLSFLVGTGGTDRIEGSNNLVTPMGTSDQSTTLGIINVHRDDTVAYAFQRNGVAYTVMTLPGSEGWLLPVLQSWEFTN